MMMLACIKQSLSNIWSSIHENAKQKKNVELKKNKNIAYKKKRVIELLDKIL